MTTASVADQTDVRDAKATHEEEGASHQRYSALAAAHRVKMRSTKRVRGAGAPASSYYTPDELLEHPVTASSTPMTTPYPLPLPLGKIPKKVATWCGAEDMTVSVFTVITVMSSVKDEGLIGSLEALKLN